MPRVRILFSKKGMSVFVPHVDLPILFTRAARRAGLAMEITQGFSPHPRTALGPPLPVGVVGLREPAEFWFADWEDGCLDAWRARMPEGIEILEARAVAGASLNKLCAAASYIIEPMSKDASGIEGALTAELAPAGLLLSVASAGSEVAVSVSDLERSGASRMVKALIAASLISGWRDLSIVRTAVGGWDEEERKVTPIAEDF
ncbi:MAG: TIGR03936 family radical SAM-associated protein [Synergistaceae bacterium]|jgi:hypothetical protein|nr:TIGR03936 family radical SAM-associated protein [Synergistaceae bacterium]